MTKLQLFLDGEELELGEQLQFPLNKAYEDLTNPTNYIVDYSKQISIPFTKKNCLILGNAYRLDRLIVSRAENARQIGLYLDPSKRIPMKIIKNGDLLLEGYAKYTSANVSNSSQTFNLNIFGKLGEVFHELNSVVVNRKFLKNPTDLKYVLNIPIDVHKLNAKYINNVWSFYPWPNIADPYTTKVEPWDVIGFAPSFRGQYPDFKSDQVFFNSWREDNVTKTKQFIPLSKVIEKSIYNRFYQEFISAGDSPAEAKEQAEEIIKNGAPGELAKELDMDYKMGQFHPYNLKPFLYFNKILYAYKHKCKELTGYDIELDPTWFNVDNPYWSRACYFLDYLDSKGSKTNAEGDLFEKLKFACNSYQPSEPELQNNGIKEYALFTGESISTTINSQNISDMRILPTKIQINAKWQSQGRVKDFIPYGAYISDKVVQETVPVPGMPGHYQVVTTIKKGYYATKIKISAEYFDVYGGVEHPVVKKDFWTAFNDDQKKVLKEIDPDCAKNEDIAFPILYTANSGGNYPIYTNTMFLTLPDIYLTDYIFKGQCKCKYTVKYYKTRERIAYYAATFDDDAPINITLPAQNVNLYNTEVVDVKQGIEPRRHLTVTLENIYRSEKPLFDIILQYCKMFGLNWQIDYTNKKIKIVTKKTLFSNYTITNWDNKIDKSKDFIIEPMTFQSSLLRFNYKDAKGYRYSGYKDKYGVSYGEKNVTTNNEFNNEKKDLFKDINTSCNSSRAFLTWRQVSETWEYGKGLRTVSCPFELIDCDNDEQKNSIALNNWYFRINNVTNPKYLQDYPMYIYDYTEEMEQNNTYCWLNPIDPDDVGGKRILEFPQFSFAYKTEDNTHKYGFIFNTPQEDYTFSKLPSDCKNNYIYDLCWDKYINERYNIQNKKVTCYVNLTPSDYKDFDFNKLVLVGNQLFMVNKIFDYDINQPICNTKVELVQITDINSYLVGNLGNPESKGKEIVVNYLAGPEASGFSYFLNQDYILADYVAEPELCQALLDSYFNENYDIILYFKNGIKMLVKVTDYDYPGEADIDTGWLPQGEYYYYTFADANGNPVIKIDELNSTIERVGYVKSDSGGVDPGI